MVVAGEMTRARTCRQPRSDQVWAIGTTFKHGWTCTTPKREERHGRRFDAGQAHLGFYVRDSCDHWSDKPGSITSRRSKGSGCTGHRIPVGSKEERCSDNGSHPG